MSVAILQRETFQTSRLLEFFSEKELTMQIGHPTQLWPIALLKELVDNALDACETAGVPPEIEVVVEEHALRVRDNGPGIPTRTIERSLDYAVRVSDKAYYVSPTRGQLGNALKCLYAAPYVVDGECGRIEITTGGVTHTITVTLDRIGQVPVLEHTTSPDGRVKTGTEVRMHWPSVASCLAEGASYDFYKPEGLLRRFAALR
jgi:DNA topoisomerase-6 subunit B